MSVNSSTTGSRATRILRLPRLRVLLSMVTTLLIVGWGLYCVIKRPVTTTNDAAIEDEVAFLEVPERAISNLQPQRLATASITDVIPAIHQQSENDTQPTIVQAGFTTVRPASNPSAWLIGIIEDATEPAQWPSQTDLSSGQTINRFKAK